MYICGGTFTLTAVGSAQGGGGMHRTQLRDLGRLFCHL